MVDRNTELEQVLDIVEAPAPLTDSQLANPDFLSALSRALEIGLVQWSAKEIEGDGTVIWQVVGKDRKCRSGSAFICNNRQVVASQVVKDNGYTQISDSSVVEEAVKQAVAGNPKAVDDYMKGKETAAKFLVGQVMRITKGKANPAVVVDLVKKALDALQKG